MLTKLRRALGIDTRQSEYTYQKDPRFGHVTSGRIADQWVKTTCGYCSVGCGMLVGVKDGRAVSVRGNPDHPVNLGKLCPKGLSEHHILDAPGRAQQPLLPKDGKLVPVSWDEALDTMVENFRTVQQKYGNDALGVVGTGQLLTEECYHPGRARTTRLPHPQQRRQHHPLHGQRRLRLQALLR
jgi:anaerobic selenocysteine-containing dehydrogenase